MDIKKVILILSIVTISSVSIYFLVKHKESDNNKKDDNDKNNSSSEPSVKNIVVATKEKILFFSIENDLSKSIYAKWSNSKNIYPVTKSLAMQHGIDHEQSNVILVSRIEYEKYNLCGAIKEGEIPK